MNNPTPPRGPIFIVGAPRSGTTLLQYILRCHPAISLPTGESHFIVPLYRNASKYGDLSKVENIKAVLKAMEAQSAEFLHTDLHGLQFDTDALAKAFADEERYTMRDILSGLFEKNAEGERKPRWGDKTPYYVLHIPKILEWWPDAQIIHLIRDGRDVALSMFARRHDFRTYNTYLAAKQWELYVEMGHSFGKQVPATQYLELRYEDILGDQNAALRRICAFLNEEYSDNLLEFKKAGGVGKTPLLRKSVQKDNLGKWKTAMSSRQIRTFESVAAPTLRTFGYTVTTTANRLPLPMRALYRWHNTLAGMWYRRLRAS